MEFQSVADVKPEEIRYLLEPYLPRGTFCLIEGDPAAGKSSVAVAIAAAITAGRALPFEAPETTRAQESVLYLGTEDRPEVIQGRAKAAAADLKRLKILKGEVVSIADVDRYRKVLIAEKPALLILDPIQAFLGGVQSSVVTSVRSVLQPLIALAAEQDCTIVGIRHLTKATSTSSTYRGSGSVDFFAAARSVLRLGRDPRDPHRRVLVHLKSSSGPEGPSQEYEIAEGRVQWLGRSELRARDLDEREPKKRARTAIEIARDFLVETLSDGAVRAKEVRRRARREGIASRTLEQAKKELGVASRRVAGEGHGEGHWEWHFARDLDPPAQAPGLHGIGLLDQERDDAPLNPPTKPRPSLGFGPDDQERGEDEERTGWRPELN